MSGNGLVDFKRQLKRCSTICARYFRLDPVANCMEKGRNLQPQWLSWFNCNFVQ